MAKHGERKPARTPASKEALASPGKSGRNAALSAPARAGLRSARLVTWSEAKPREMAGGGGGDPGLVGGGAPACARPQQLGRDPGRSWPGSGSPPSLINRFSSWPACAFAVFSKL